MSKKRIGRPPRDPGLTYSLRDVPREEWRRFRAACRRSGFTARDALIRLIRKSAEKEKIA